jgi:hypothetical protein
MELLGQAWNNNGNGRETLLTFQLFRQRSKFPLMGGAASFCALRRTTAT